MIRRVCDFCGKDTDHFQVDLPVELSNTDYITFWHGHQAPYGFKAYDVCEKCMKKLIKTIENLKGA